MTTSDDTIREAVEAATKELFKDGGVMAWLVGSLEGRQADPEPNIARVAVDALAKASLLRQEMTEEVHCPAVMHHGPGSQSSTRCERRSPHSLDDEHYARNPMEPGFEWTGRDGWGNR